LATPEAGKDGKVGAALVVGGGIGGMQAALDLAASGIKVYLVEQKASIGGVMAQLDKTFPTNDCAMCTQAPRLVEVGRHRDVEVITFADVERLAGTPGSFQVTVRKRPRFVVESRCTGCGTCTTNCPVRSRVQPLPLTEAELEPGRRETVAAILRRHAATAGPLMPVLQEISAAFNYFPGGVLEYVAQRTGYPLTHVYRVATFYGAFSVRPRGKHTVSVCMGTTCYVRGSARLMEKFSEALKIEPDETTPDLRFTLKSVRCIGCCGLAPALAVGESVFGKVTPKEVAGIVARYQADGDAEARAG
jgi:NADH:ubiquinone oxidoreductase subunit E